MKYQRYDNVQEFYKDTYHVFMKHEAQNILPLGNIILGNQGGEKKGWRNPQEWYMAAVSNEKGDIQLSVIMTPPFNITMYETDNEEDNEGLTFFCENFIKEQLDIPGVISESALAERFARLYCEKTGKTYKVHQDKRIYTIHKVNENIKKNGKLRKASSKDMHFLPYWNKSFYEDCHLSPMTLEESVSEIEQLIQTGTLFILEDGGVPVSMASSAREMVHGRCVGSVYTPPHFRNKGYAGSCVSQLTQNILDRGCDYAALFTDLANPTSNSIYQKIGYQPICDYKDIWFMEK